MRKPDTILDEVHMIRSGIDKKTKNMTHDEINEYFNTTGERVAKKYGFRRISVDEARGYSYEVISNLQRRA